MKKLFLIGMVLALAACASSHVIVGTQRAPISPENVQVYLQPPAHYEQVALLEASDVGANGFSAQSRTNKIMKRLKLEAANLGANGILFQGFETHSVGSVGTFNGAAYGNNFSGLGISAAAMQKSGTAIAIFVDNSLPAAPTNSQMQAAPPPPGSCVSCQNLGH